MGDLLYVALSVTIRQQLITNFFLQIANHCYNFFPDSNTFHHTFENGRCLIYVINLTPPDKSIPKKTSPSIANVLLLQNSCQVVGSQCPSRADARDSPPSVGDDPASCTAIPSRNLIFHGIVRDSHYGIPMQYIPLPSIKNPQRLENPIKIDNH